MQDNKLLEMKESIVKELGPLVTDDKLEPEERFDFYYSIANSTLQFDPLQNAFSSAKQIDDKERKANCLLKLLELVSIMQESTVDKQDIKS
ncbi:hypothetical protein KBC85_01620 [Candidatus Saccharibacteria bacterium]|nr:hypothetical protein [Candidatus Saccharibacteria bacterium]MDQ5884943.1 hypothetical protein [Patescibacteria group bacterium]MDQ5953595.1 hypothetical protein [Patescibacteria group bacterium]MDQ5969948.1 hypothetical protein [Patescibacteria group bacterium]